MPNSFAAADLLPYVFSSALMISIRSSFLACLLKPTACVSISVGTIQANGTNERTLRGRRSKSQFVRLNFAIGECFLPISAS